MEYLFGQNYQYPHFLRSRPGEAEKELFVLLELQLENTTPIFGSTGGQLAVSVRMGPTKLPRGLFPEDGTDPRVPRMIFRIHPRDAVVTRPRRVKHARDDHAGRAAVRGRGSQAPSPRLNFRGRTCSASPDRAGVINCGTSHLKSLSPTLAAPRRPARLRDRPNVQV